MTRLSKKMSPGLGAGLLALSLAPSTAQAQINLVVDRSLSWTTTIPADGLGAGEVDPLTGDLWVADSGLGNGVYRLDPQTFSILSSFSASIIPGMNAGPDGLAIDPANGDIHLFSVFTESVSGIITSAGSLVSTHIPTRRPAAAAFDNNGRLFAVSDSGILELLELDKTNHSILSTTPITGVSSRVTALTFHPVTNAPLIMIDSGDLLGEIDPVSGSLLWSVPLVPTGAFGSFPGLMATGDNPDELFVGGGVATSGPILELVAYPLDGSIGTVYCDSLPNSTGAVASIAATGSPQVADNDLLLRSEMLPPGSFGYYLASRNPGVVSMPGGSQGILCLVGNIGRFNDGPEIRQADATGAFELAVDLTMVPEGGMRIAVVPGDTWHFQGWYRDVNPNPTSNFTDAVEVSFQ